MCGISGFISVYPQNHKDLHRSLLAIEKRGGHAYGFAFLNKKDQDNIWFFKETGRVPQNFESTNIAEIGDTNIAIAHSRWATNGAANDKNCAHPFCSRDYAIVHNGIISNKHEAQKTECDSEAILKLCISHKGDFKKVAEELEGMFRVAIIDGKNKQLVLIGDGDSLYIGRRHDRELWFASDHDMMPTGNFHKKVPSSTILYLTIHNKTIIITEESFKKKTREYVHRPLPFDYTQWEHERPIYVPQNTGFIGQPAKKYRRGWSNAEQCAKCQVSDCRGCPLLDDRRIG